MRRKSHTTLTYTNLDVLGEYIRSDIVEDQEGVPITVDGQFIDITTCEPITDLYWDLWVRYSAPDYDLHVSLKV